MTDEKGWFPLMFASLAGHKEAVELLVEKRADVSENTSLFNHDLYVIFYHRKQIWLQNQRKLKQFYIS